ncbi:hypothetical protein QL285_026006 [Trifolium repens]|nr:hypothetical protein QL285_026006 [Trifolium repens]
MRNLVQNYQYYNSQFLPPSSNSNILYRPQMVTQGVEFTCYEIQTPIRSMPKCQVLQFSTQVDLENIMFEEGENLSVKKKLESYSQEKMIYFLFNRGSTFQKIQL